MRNLMLIILCSVSFAIQNIENGILFSYDDKNAQSVFLVGTMNDWNQTINPMKKDENGIWKIILKLEEGKYAYKFVVDGDWAFDQENPNFEDDGFGGSNSIIEIDNNGQILKNQIKNNGIKSSFNPKVYFDGRYFSNNLFSQNQVDRYMLNKPMNDLNFGIKVKFSSNLMGYTLLNVNNINEETEMWKTHLNYKRTLLKLNTDYFNVTAFDNFGVVIFDDPFNLVGNIGYNEYDFGYGQGGVLMETSDLFSDNIFKILSMGMKAQMVFSDKIGYDDDDISAMRVKFSIPTSKNNKFILGFSNYNYMTISNDIIQMHDNQAVDFSYVKDFYRSSWKEKMKLTFISEYSKFKNSDEEVLESIWMEGENFILGMSLKFPAALKIHLNYHQTSLELQENFSRNRYTFGFNYLYNHITWNIVGQLWENKLSANLDWGNYYKYFEKTDGNGRWFQEHSDISFEKYTVLGYESGFTWESDIHYKFKIRGHITELILKNRFAHHDILSQPKFIENIIAFNYDISKEWKLFLDTRIPYYNDPFLQLKTDFKNNEDVFISSYLEIAHYFSKDVWLSIGYGIDPIVVNSITDQFYDRGRQEYLNNVGGLSNYLESFYGGFGGKIREAERSLMNEKRISLQAVITF